MSTELVWLALLMFAVTYPSRALGLLTPGLERLPRVALDYLQLVGPAVLASLAVVNAVIAIRADRPILNVGIEAFAVVACMAITVWRKNLLLGLLVAVVLVAVARAGGIAPPPG